MCVGGRGRGFLPYGGVFFFLAYRSGVSVSLPRQASKRESPKVETEPSEWRMTKPVSNAATCVAGGWQSKMDSGWAPALRDDKDEYFTSLLLSLPSPSLSGTMAKSSPEAVSADV